MHMKKGKQLKLLLFTFVLAGLFWNTTIICVDRHNDSEASHLTEDALRMDSQTTLAATQEVEITTTVWENVFDYPENAFCFDVVRCSDNGFCAAGYVYNPSYADFVLIRTDSNGQQLWNHTYVAPDDIEYTHSLIECSDGGFAIAGTYMNMSPTGINLGWLLKTNSTGHHEWNKTYDDTKYFLDIIEDSDGGFLLAGQGRYVGGADTYVVVVKVDSNGNEIWKEHCGGPEINWARSIIELSSSDIIVIGSVETGDQTDAQVMKLASDGTFIWQRLFGTEEEEAAYAAIECDDGGFLLTGGALRDSDVQLWCCKINMAGDHEWSKTYPSYHAGRDIEFVGSKRYAVATNKILYIDGEGNPLWKSVIGMGYGEAIVRCENSEIVAAGRISGNDIKLARIPWLDWNQTPVDPVNEYLTPFVLSLNATCSTGIISWSVNDTSNFQVNSVGIVSNITTLDVGNYAIEVTVNDTLDNQLKQTFTLTVEDTTDPTWSDAIEDQVLEAGTSFNYDVNAEDGSSIDEWRINSTTYFEIDDIGVISNQMALGVGDYGIEVRASDPYGNELVGVFTVFVTDTTSPVWVLSSTGSVIQYGETIEIDLVATDFSGISSWSCNDTSHFAIQETFYDSSSHCRITDIITLDVGQYGLSVTVYDSYGNPLSLTFTITVQESTATTTTTTTTATSIPTTTTTTPPTTPAAPADYQPMILIAAASGWGVALVAIILVVRRKT